ncbi:MAG: hypothetical protein ABI207_04220 [Crocinitomicaceae bacterium]
MKTSAAKISIPTPCHEDWNKMTDQQMGRHCDSCNKVVVDFTQSSQQEVIDYMHIHQNEKVCGRVNPEILEPSIFANFQSDKLTKLKIFACALFMVFGSSLFGCSQTNKPLMGDIAAPVSTQQAPPDSLVPVAGGIQYFPPDTLKPEKIEPINHPVGRIQYHNPDTIRPIKGEIQSLPPEQTERPEKAEPVKMGKMKIEEPQKSKEGKVTKCTGEIKNEEQHPPMMGMIALPQHREEPNKEEEN